MYFFHLFHLTFVLQLHKIAKFMKIPDELLKRWNDLKSFGDGKKIAEENPEITDRDVSVAFSKGECSDKVFEAIADYYKQKEEKIKEYL